MKNLFISDFNFLNNFHLYFKYFVFNIINNEFLKYFYLLEYYNNSTSLLL